MYIYEYQAGEGGYESERLPRARRQIYGADYGVGKI